MIRSSLLPLALALMWTTCSPPARASSASLDVELAVEVESSARERASGDRAAARVTTAELALDVGWAMEAWSIEVGVVLEPVTELERSAATLAREDLFVETLALRWEHERLAARLGRYTPPFGIAWHAAPRSHGTDFAEDYELAERWGLGAAVRWGSGSWGRHTLSADAFFVDTTALAGSLFGRRERARGTDGGPGNTGRPASFVLQLEGAEVPPLPGLRYHASLLHQARGEGDAAREWGLALALQRRFERGAVALTPLVELAHLGHPDGVRGVARYWTLGLELERSGWHAAAVLATRERNRAEESTRDQMLHLSLGRALPSGARLELGWRRVVEQGRVSQTLGLRVAWTGRPWLPRLNAARPAAQLARVTDRESRS